MDRHTLMMTTTTIPWPNPSQATHQLHPPFTCTDCRWWECSCCCSTGRCHSWSHSHIPRHSPLPRCHRRHW